MGDSDTSQEFNRLNGSSRRRHCLEDQENQIQDTSAKVIIQDGWSVPVKNLTKFSVPVRDTSDKVSFRTDGRIPLLILSRNSVWPMRVFVWPREMSQMRRRAKGAWEGDLSSSR